MLSSKYSYHGYEQFFFKLLPSNFSYIDNKQLCYHLYLSSPRWVNRKDPDGLNVFEGGFLGLDNIGVFDRSKPLPTGGKLAQADGTAWMAFFCELMVEFSLILAQRDQIYEDMASKFFEHFVYIMDAINSGVAHLWDEEDGFYYDCIIFEDHKQPLKIRSMVGMVSGT